MNHLESAFEGKNNVWRYIVMLVAILLVANTIGSVPLIVAMMMKASSDPSVMARFAESPNDMSILGLSSTSGFIVMMIPFITGLLAFMLLVKPLHNRSFKKVINGTSQFRWNKLLISALVWFLLSAIYFFVYLKLDPSNFALNTRSSSILVLIIISVVFIPFQAALEEVLFRGYLMQGFSVAVKNRWLPLIITSLFFGLLHSFNPEVKEFGFFTMIPQYIVFGLIFGIAVVFDDGIEVSIGAHAANNIFLCVMVTSRSSILQTPALYVQNTTNPWNEFIGLTVSGIVFIIILKAVFRWGDYSILFSKVRARDSIQNDQIL
jgi:uncharacterized protein